MQQQLAITTHACLREAFCRASKIIFSTSVAFFAALRSYWTVSSTYFSQHSVHNTLKVYTYSLSVSQTVALSAMLISMYRATDFPHFTRCHARSQIDFRKSLSASHTYILLEALG